MLACQSAERRIALHRSQLAHHRADAATKFNRPSWSIAMPEGHLSRLTGRGRNQYAIMRNLVDAPRGRAQDKGISGVALEDHFLVELADSHRLFRRAGQEHSIQPAIGNRPAVQNCQAFRSGARSERVAVAIPGDARTQLGEFIRRIPAGEHVEYAIECSPAEGGEGGSTRNQPV